MRKGIDKVQLRRCIGLALWCCLGQVAPAQLPCRYELSYVAAPPCSPLVASPTRGMALNNQDLPTVVGYFTPCLFSPDQAFHWQGEGALTVMTLPPGATFARAFDINDSIQANGIGQIVGQIDYEGFLWQNETWTMLPCLEGDNMCSADAVNDGGIAVGGSTNISTGPYRAIYWQDGVATALKLPIGPSSVATDISNSGAIVGWMGDSTATNAHSFIWQDGVVTDLGVIPGGYSCVPNAVNSHGDVVGVGSVDNLGGEPIGFGLLYAEGHLNA